MEKLTPCSCCLLRPADKDLQTPYARLGAPEIYSHMIRDCFGIRITLSDDDACGICLVCVGRLRDASDFKLQVQHTQAELQVRLQKGAHVEEQESAVELDTEAGAATSDEYVLKSSLSERECFSDEESAAASDDDCILLELNGAAEARTEPVLFVSARAREQLAQACCVRLERLRDSPRASQPRPATPHRAPSPARSVQDAPHTPAAGADPQPYTCDTCKTHFTDKSTLITHIQNHTTRTDESENLLVEHDGKKPYVCKDCNKRFTQRGGLNYHEKTHSGVKPYVCKVCNKGFGRKDHLQIHERIHSGVRPYSCKVCNKQFTQIGGLIGHERIHSGVKPYVCKVCNKRFAEMRHLKRHDNKHSGVKPYMCKVCNKRFTGSRDLNYHEKTHSGVKPYTCKECNMLFARKSNLERHERTLHRGVKPYVCMVCSKRFTTKNSLHFHENIHSGVKPYICKVCHKRFTQIQSLKSHETTHSGVKPYKCRECSILFTTKGNLNRHERIHSGVKPYSCEECNEGFTRKDHKDAHRTSAHKVATSYKGLDWNIHLTQKGTLENHKITQHNYDESDKHLNKMSSDARVGVKPYSCEECNNKFTSQCELERHKRIHTGEESYECEICESIFFDEASLITHVNTHTTKIAKS